MWIGIRLSMDTVIGEHMEADVYRIHELFIYYLINKISCSLANTHILLLSY